MTTLGLSQIGLQKHTTGVTSLWDSIWVLWGKYPSQMPIMQNSTTVTVEISIKIINRSNNISSEAHKLSCKLGFRFLRLFVLSGNKIHRFHKLVYKASSFKHCQEKERVGRLPRACPTAQNDWDAPGTIGMTGTPWTTTMGPPLGLAFLRHPRQLLWPHPLRNPLTSWT